MIKVKAVPIRELAVGEMFTFDFDGYMIHHYYEVVGHEHPEFVIVKSTMDHLWHTEEKVPYDQIVRVRPDAYKHIRKELLPEWECYKRWPYDENGVFCWPPKDYSKWGQS